MWLLCYRSLEQELARTKDDLQKAKDMVGGTPSNSVEMLPAPNSNQSQSDGHLVFLDVLSKSPSSGKLLFTFRVTRLGYSLITSSINGIVYIK